MKTLLLILMAGMVPTCMFPYPRVEWESFATVDGKVVYTGKNFGEALSAAIAALPESGGVVSVGSRRKKSAPLRYEHLVTPCPEETLCEEPK